MSRLHKEQIRQWEGAFMISEASYNTQIQHMEQRIQTLESLVTELQSELQNLKHPLPTNAHERLKKMQNYQRELDQMFGLNG